MAAFGGGARIIKKSVNTEVCCLSWSSIARSRHGKISTYQYHITRVFALKNTHGRTEPKRLILIYNTITSRIILGSVPDLFRFPLYFFRRTKVNKCPRLDGYGWLTHSPVRPASTPSFSGATLWVEPSQGHL